jgi:monoamine oxidase
MSTLQFDPNLIGYNADVVVVGGGLSGLTAAYRLANQGVDVAILEARERAGGRMASGTFNGEAYDLGAHWVAPNAVQLRKIIHDLGLPLTTQYHDGESAVLLGNKSYTFKQRSPMLSPAVSHDRWSVMRLLNRYARAMQTPTNKVIEQINAFDQLSFGLWLKQTCRFKQSIAWFNIMCRIRFNAEPSEISLIYIIDQVQAFQKSEYLFPYRPAFQQERVVGGAQRIGDRLATQLRPQLQLDAPVLAMRQDDTSITAYSRGSSVRARYAVIALPPAVAEQIYFEPHLPPGRDALNQRILMGRAIEAILCYDYPFWRENNKSGFMLSDSGPAVMVHDVSPATNTEGALACLIAGNAASHWGAQPRGERLRALVQQLSGWLGNEAGAYRGMIERDWNSERWNRGSVGFMPPGTSSFVHSINMPVGRIHWAGSEASTQWTGTLEGAIDAGEKAAEEIIRQLREGGHLKAK